ncbi:MAG: DUF4189 domain-containing protein [Hyphomicrobiales bacterium]|nr:MAG: DUF4189 domain-containing protein [Hyphomicrobiales bacterium]
MNAVRRRQDFEMGQAAEKPRRGLRCFVSSVAIGAILLTSASMALRAQQHNFAAIAFSPKTGKMGIAQDNASQAEAEAVALSNCQAETGQPSDCVKGGWTRDGCVAIAIAENRAWGANFGNDRNAANQNAIAMCAKYAGADAASCKPVRVVCTARR